jgi:outer membrane protein TolC
MITKADYLMAEVFVSNLESQKAEVESQYKNAMITLNTCWELMMILN